MSDCFVLYLLLTCMKKKTSGADKFTNNNRELIMVFRLDLKKQAVSGNNKRKSRSKESRAAPFSVLSDIS